MDEEELKYIDVDLVNLEYNKKYNIDIENYESQIFTGKKIVKVLNYVNDNLSNSIHIIYIKDSIENIVEQYVLEFVSSMYKMVNNVAVLYISDRTLNSILIGRSRVNMTNFIDKFNNYKNTLRKLNNVSSFNVNECVRKDIFNMKVCMHNMLNMLFARIIKYQSRGFEVDIPLDYVNLDKTFFRIASI
jgi:hypothetical protein